MQIIIPMSGFGERFRRAGYTVPKPLIEIDGKPIIAHVIDMFPGENDFIFICNQDHLDTPEYRMEEIIRAFCPAGRIVGIAPHKLGPIHAVRQVSHLIDDSRPVVLNYCDFTCYWNWSDFKQFAIETNSDGIIPAYKGFHPHTLGTTNYAYMLESNGWVEDIQEKQPYTNNRMEEYASSGTYYFSTGLLMKEALQATMNEGLNVGGEYYVSLAYKPILKQGKRIAVYPLQHFMQWGTPDDVAEYNSWSSLFRDLMNAEEDNEPARGAVIVPMAGLGQRFVNEGYHETKPLIPVSGRPMVIQATADMPHAKHYAFVLREDMSGHERITQALLASYPEATIKTIPHVTEGQACTALLGLEALENSLGQVEGPLTFAACDSGAIYDRRKFTALVDSGEADVIVWAVRGHANAIRNPNMFGWIRENNEVIEEISVKKPLSDPKNDPVVLGTFTFRTPEVFKKVVQHLFDRDGKVNNEFYLDSCVNDAIELGFKCRVFIVDHYISWGTPNDLRTFEYWQSCFHKWASHPYRLEADKKIPSSAVHSLIQRFERMIPDRPVNM